MANEIQASSTLTYSYGGTAVTLSKSASISPSATDYVSGSQVVGTSEETIALVDIGTIGMVLIINDDASNYVEVGGATGVYHNKILAGESFGPVRWNTAGVYMKANGAPCTVRYLVTEA